MADAAAEPEPPPVSWTIDELAQLAHLPVRTIREYQTLGVLPGPRREGRVGRYASSHLRRLELVARLRDRGYSLAAIVDLLGSWRAGADLGEVLGLEADQLVHVDEPGVPVTLEQLQALLPRLIPAHLDELEATGAVERLASGRLRVPSPSLLQLAVEVEAAGLAPAQVLGLLAAISRAADGVADHVVELFGVGVTDLDPAAQSRLVTRGRGLLAHGLGRLTLHRIGHRLGIDTTTSAP